MIITIIYLLLLICNNHNHNHSLPVLEVCHIPERKQVHEQYPQYKKPIPGHYGSSPEALVHISCLTLCSLATSTPPKHSTCMQLYSMIIDVKVYIQNPSIGVLSGFPHI